MGCRSSAQSEMANMNLHAIKIRMSLCDRRGCWLGVVWDKLLVRSLFVSNDIDGEYDEC